MADRCSGYFLGPSTLLSTILHASAKASAGVEHGSVAVTAPFTCSILLVGNQISLLVPIMSEHRAKPRLRTLKGGSILIGLAATIDCKIRNLSETGACLIVQSQIGIPDDFALLVKPEMRKRNCHVAWRKADRIGVRFI